MRPIATLASLVSLALIGCTRTPTFHDLQRVKHPAFVARLQQGAGPHASVFNSDKDKKLEGAMGRAMTRFELADGLRVQVFNHLPAQAPWTHVVDPASVASVLETFLVQEVPADSPDFDSLQQLGTDAVVDLVIESYGLHGNAQAVSPYIKGHGRMFFVHGDEIWSQSFSRDAAEMGRPPLNPYKLVDDPEIFRAEMNTLIEQAGSDLAKGLSPSPGE